MIGFPLMGRNSPKNIWFITVQFWGWVYNHYPEVIKWIIPIVNCFLPLSLKIMLGWIFVSSPPLILDLVIAYLCCFTLVLIFIWFIWYKPPQDISILISWFNYFKQIIMYEKILMIRQTSIFFLRYSNQNPPISFIKF